MSVSVHYVDNARNVKTNRGGITGYILPIPLPSLKLLYIQVLLYFYAILLILYYMCILLYIL